MSELSLNEVESLALKVGRGAGYSWGLAEEIARGGRALARGGFPWADALLALARESVGWRAPAVGLEAATGTLLCPVRVAARLIDDASILGAGALRIGDVGRPLWVSGLFAAAGLSEEFEAEWSGGALAAAADVLISRRAAAAWRGAGRRRAQADPETLAALEAWAARIYVPSSACSRAKGAGGGSVDDE